MSPVEFAELDTYLQRAGVGRSEFIRDTVMSKVRGATTFGELLPTIAASMERQIAELLRKVDARSDEICALAAAAVAASASLREIDAASDEVAMQEVEGAIRRAIRYAPRIVADLQEQAVRAPPGASKR